MIVRSSLILTLIKSNVVLAFELVLIGFTLDLFTLIKSLINVDLPELDKPKM